jgi:hypothetical protein
MGRTACTEASVPLQGCALPLPLPKENYAIPRKKFSQNSNAINGIE